MVQLTEESDAIPPLNPPANPNTVTLRSHSLPAAARPVGAAAASGSDVGADRTLHDFKDLSDKTVKGSITGSGS